PLSLKEVADDIGVHETTVSRVVNGKYVQTDWGIFELRRFFTTAVPSSASSGPQSKESVKEAIRSILEQHALSTGNSRLSDREVAEMLAQRGIHIARRTVAKYRSELGGNASFGRGRH
ncbi:MAG: RNA polymerase sigma-54 factor, partial [Rectinema sp.]